MKKNYNKDLLNPKQLIFLTEYLNINGKNFANAKQSALAAGYEESYANNITNLLPKWLSDALSDNTMLARAERNLGLLLDEKKDLRVKADITKFTLSTLGKKKYSTRTETDVTSKGEAITGITYVVPEKVEEKTEE